MFYCLSGAFLRVRCVLLLLSVFVLSGILSAAEKRIVVLATADLHGHFENLSTISAAVRRSPENTIYVDVGDCIQGSLALTLAQGAGALKHLQDADCSLFVPGNHELDYGFEVFRKLVSESPVKVAAANLHAPELDGKVQDFLIVEKSGVKIAFIGICN